MVKIVWIVDPGHASNATEEDMPFADTFIRERGKSWYIISPLLHVTDAWPHVKSPRKNRGGHKAMLLFCGHFGGPNDVDRLQNQAEMKLQNLMYAWEKKELEL